MANACQQRPLATVELPAATGQPPSNAQSTALTLVRYGVLKVFDGGTARQPMLQTDSRWRHSLDAARRRASVGNLDSGQRLLLVGSSTAHWVYGMLADRDQIDPRLMWMARIPDSGRFGLLVALDPEVSEDAYVRLLAELRQDDVSLVELKLGRRTDFDGIRSFAAESLPGAFLEED